MYFNVKRTSWKQHKNTELRNAFLKNFIRTVLLFCMCFYFESRSNNGNKKNPKNMMKSQKQDNHIYLRYKLVWYNKISLKYRNAQGLSMYKHVFFAKDEERICSFQWPCAVLYFYGVLKKLFWHYFATHQLISRLNFLYFSIYTSFFSMRILNIYWQFHF